MRGWLGYYGIAEMETLMKQWNEWLRRRIRMYIWKQWKKPRTRVANLKKLGMPEWQAYRNGNTRKGYWAVTGSGILHHTICVLDKPPQTCSGLVWRYVFLGKLGLYREAKSVSNACFMAFNNTTFALEVQSSYGFNLLDHLAADRTGLTGCEVAVIALLEVYADF